MKSALQVSLNHKPAACSIEVLESRIAPAAFTVTSLADSGTGTLRAALALADSHSGPDTIAFHLPTAGLVNGAWTIGLTSGGLTSLGDVTIKGPGAGKLIINGGGKYEVFNFNAGTNAPDAPVTISGLSMINGSSGFGSAVFSAESLTLKNVVVSGNTAAGGFAVKVQGNANPKVNISNSLITGNTGMGGGGVGLYRVKLFAISKTIMTDNTVSGGDGGGIYASIGPSGTTGTITGCLIAGNTAQDGAGVHVADENNAPASRITISASRITGNTATGTGLYAGGGVYASFGNTVITGSTIENNTAAYDGGGVNAYQCHSLTISNCIISGNQTTKTKVRAQGGGGVFIDGHGSGALLPAKISGSHITDNQSAYSGGGVEAANGIALTVSSSTISGNASPGFGGGIGTYGESASPVSLSVTGTTLSGNTAHFGGGIYTGNGGTPGAAGAVSIVGSKITGNESLVSAGGIYIDDCGMATIKASVFTGNITATYGGGLAIGYTTSFHVSACTFTGNVAGTTGGGINVNSATGSILSSVISGNVASTGGGVFNGGTTPGTVKIHLAEVTGNTAPNGSNTFGPFTYV